MIAEEFSMRRAQFEHIAEYLYRGSEAEERLEERSLTPEELRASLCGELRGLVKAYSIGEEAGRKMNALLERCIDENQRAGFFIGLRTGAKTILSLTSEAKCRL